MNSIDTIVLSSETYGIEDAEARNVFETARRIANRTYKGIDLSEKFADEIAASPFFGDVWAWIKARTQAECFDGMSIEDYVPFIADGNFYAAEIAGINTYKGYGDVEPGIDNHIDFITRDCHPTTFVMNRANYNNGTTTSPNPWLTSDLYARLNNLNIQVPNATTANPALVAAGYTATGIFNTLPANLRNVIVEKKVYVPRRYTAGQLLTDDNSWDIANIGKLWIPSETEVYGQQHWSTRGNNQGFEGGFVQYPIFNCNMKRIKGAGNGGTRTTWWLLSARSGNSTNFCSVYLHGNASSASASGTSLRVPLCFRIS